MKRNGWTGDVAADKVAISVGKGSLAFSAHEIWRTVSRHFMPDFTQWRDLCEDFLPLFISFEERLRHSHDCHLQRYYLPINESNNHQYWFIPVTWHETRARGTIVQTACLVAFVTNHQRKVTNPPTKCQYAFKFCGYDGNCCVYFG